MKALSSLTTIVALSLAQAAPAPAQFVMAADDAAIASARGGSVLETPARLALRDVALPVALSTLEMRSGVKIAFSPSLLSNYTASCDCTDVSVGVALDRMLAGTVFRYSAFGQQVIVESALRPERPRERSRMALASLEGGASLLAEPEPPRSEAESPEGPAAPARQGTITGQVTDIGTGAPLAGAQVFVPGSNLGSITGADGRYRLLNVPAGQVTVQVRLLGYGTEERTVTVATGETLQVDFALTAQAIRLGEVVASVDAVDVRRRELGTDIASIDVQEAVTEGAVTDLSELLQARGAGISVTRGSGLAGSASQIRIRGPSSLTQDNTPLIIIDGVRASHNTTFGTSATAGGGTSRLNDLNPADIASMQVVKGPAATALYGSEAAPGVIVITTKQGQAGVPEFRIGTRVGVINNDWDYPDNYSNVTEFYGVTDLNDPRISQFPAEQNPLTGEIFIKHNPFENPTTSPFRQGYIRDLSASARGGGDRVRYFTSASYAVQQGVVDVNEYNRGNFTGDLDFSLTDNLTIRTNVGLVQSERGFPQDNSTGSGVGVNGFLGSPAAAFGADGTCARDALLRQPTGTSGWCEQREGNFGQSFDVVMGMQDQGEAVFRSLGSASAEWRAREWFVNLVTVGIDRTERDRWSRWLFDPTGRSPVSEGSFTERRYTDSRITAQYSGTITGSLGEAIDRTTTLGLQYYSSDIDWLICQGEDYPNDEVRGCGSGFISSGESGLQQQKEVGAFLQQRVGYNDYLFVTGALRVDDNAALGADVGAIWSPSFNASLVVSDLPFWNPSFANSLRLRGAWGTASQSPDPFAADRTYGSAPVTIGGRLVGGITPLNPGNPLLGPERSEELELGLDAGFFQDDRVGLTLTYYDITTTDLIVPRQVAPSSGFPGTQLVNLGEMQNKGLEIQLRADLIRRPDFLWEASLSHSQFDPVITDLGLDAPLFFPIGADGGSRAAGSQVFQTGFAPGAYVSPVITSATRDANGRITSFEMAPGNLGDGSNRRVIGSPWPEGEQSLSTSVTFREAFTVSALFDRVYGQDLLNVTRMFRTPFITTPGSSAFSREYAFRQVDSTPEEQAMIEQRLFAPFLEKGDFVKFRELNVSYAIPDRWSARFGTSAARITLAGRNLHTWSDFSILDPEMDVQGGRDSFIRNNFAGTFPPMRTFWVGLDFTF